MDAESEMINKAPRQHRTASGIFDKRDPPEADKSPLRFGKLQGILTKANRTYFRINPFGTNVIKKSGVPCSSGDR
jgi:hypothetical protein